MSDHDDEIPEDQDTDENISEDNVKENDGKGFVDDDILKQAGEFGIAAANFGVKTGKLLFNTGRLGVKALMKILESQMGTMQKNMDQVNEKKELIQSYSNEQLINIMKNSHDNYEKHAANIILKERGYGSD